jgi:hypothetical protein
MFFNKLRMKLGEIQQQNRHDSSHWDEKYFRNMADIIFVQVLWIVWIVALLSLEKAIDMTIEK